MAGSEISEKVIIHPAKDDERIFKNLLEAASLFRGAAQQRVTDKGKEMPGTAPHRFFPAQSFESDGLGDVQMEREEKSIDVPEPAASAASSSSSGAAPKSSVRYRAGTLVFIKPAAGS
jgi:hypothetical protein